VSPLPWTTGTSKDILSPGGTTRGVVSRRDGCDPASTRSVPSAISAWGPSLNTPARRLPAPVGWVSSTNSKDRTRLDTTPRLPKARRLAVR